MTSPDFQKLFECAPGCYMVLSPTFEIIAVSNAYLQATLTGRDIVGRPLFEVFPDNPNDPHADGVANLKASLERVLAHQRTDRMGVQKYDIPKSEGGEVSFEERYWSPVNTPIFGENGAVTAILHSAEDVTDVVRLRKQGHQRDEAYRDLRISSELRFAQLLDASPDPMVIVKESGEIAFVNSRAESFFGYSRTELVGKPVSLLVPEKIRASHGHHFESYLKDPLARPMGEDFELCALRKDGSEVPVEVSLSPLRGAEGLTISASIRDVTLRRRQAEELQAARVEAEAASAAKSEFLSSMSHELRTPMNAILGFAQLLQRDQLEPLTLRHRERVQQILVAGDHLLHLIDDILDLARIESGKVSLSTEPIDVGEVVSSVKATLEPFANANGVELEAATVSAALPPAKADRMRLTQVLMNLGSNAIKYNRAGGRVAFRLELEGVDKLRISVRDTGFGISEEQQAKLFQPFYRAGHESGPIQGTGIGLVVCKRLLELMGGRISLDSTVGHGSTFTISLPVAEALPAPPPAVAPPSPPPRWSNDRNRVLYVEDSPANIAFMRALLENYSELELYTAVTAEDGIARAKELAPGVIIMDINLPRMGGIAALAVLRSDPATADIPVIALSAAASARDRSEGRRAGFDAYLTKPVDIDELLSVLESALRPRERLG